MTYWDTTEEWDDETEGVVTVRGPYDVLNNERKTVCDAFQVAYRPGCPPREFTAAGVIYKASNETVLTINPKARYDIVIYALRYVLGRKTFAPHTFIEWITPQIGKLTPNTCALMVRDIHEWAEMVGRTEALRGWYSEHDLTQWEPLLEALEERIDDERY